MCGLEYTRPVAQGYEADTVGYVLTTTNEPNGKQPHIALYVHCTAAAVLACPTPERAFDSVVRHLDILSQRDLTQHPTGRTVASTVTHLLGPDALEIWSKAAAAFLPVLEDPSASAEASTEEVVPATIALQPPVEKAAEALDELAAAGLDGQLLLDRFINFTAAHHLNLVWSVANRLTHHLPEFSAESVFGLGWVGLTRALTRYDPAAGALSTIAVPNIRGRIMDGMRNERPLPKRMATFLNSVTEATDFLAEGSGTVPSSEAVAEHLVRLNEADFDGLPIEIVAQLIQKELKRISELTRAMQAVHATSCSVPSDDSPALDVRALEDVEGVVVAAAVSNEVRDAVTGLPPLLAEAVELVHFNEMTYTAAAVVMNLTPAQVSTAYKAALAALATKLEAFSPVAA